MKSFFSLLKYRIVNAIIYFIHLWSLWFWFWRFISDYKTLLTNRFVSFSFALCLSLLCHSQLNQHIHIYSMMTISFCFVTQAFNANVCLCLCALRLVYIFWLAGDFVIFCLFYSFFLQNSHIHDFILTLLVNLSLSLFHSLYV